MRLLADMGIGMDVVVAIRAAGHDARHLREENLQRLEDDQILEKARRESRIVLTHDLDFGRLLAISNLSGPSVVTFRLSDMSPPSVIPRLISVLDTFNAELTAGAAISVSDSSARCRRLPLAPTN